MRTLKLFPAALVCALVALYAPVVAAQSELEGKSFDELIGQAKTAYEAENYPEAIKYLIAANRAQPNARLLLNIAKSYEKSGDCVKALVYFRAFVRDPEAEPALMDQANESLSKSASCSGWNDLMTGRLLITANQPGASATVDGQSVGTLPTEVAGLMEGDHTIVVTLDGYQPFEETLKLYPDKDAKVSATMREEVQEVVVDDPGPTPTIPEKEPTPVVPYIIAGSVSAVGLGVFVGGLIVDLGIPGKFDDPREQTGISQEEFDELTEDRKSAASTAVILYVVGGVLVAGGATYGAITAATSGKKESSKPMMGFAPTVGANGFGFSFNGTF